MYFYFIFLGEAQDASLLQKSASFAISSFYKKVRIKFVYK